MRDREVHVEDQDRESALAKAADLLGAPSEDIVLDSADNGFTARLRNAPADVDISVTDNGTRAVIGAYAPPLGSGGKLDVVELQSRLEEAGIVEGIDHDGIVEVMVALEEGRDPTGTVVARGKKPREPRDARLKPAGDLHLPVFRGDVVGTVEPAIAPDVGFSVLGAPVPPKRISAPQDLCLAENAGLILDPESGELTAERYGLVVIENCTLRLEPLLFESRDKLSLRAILYHRDAKKRPITFDRIAALLHAMNVALPPDREAVEEGLAASKAQDGPVETVIVKGSEPQHGEDGRFESPYAGSMVAGEELEDGSVNFYERGAVRTVEEGKHLGRIVPAQKGTPGRDIYGTPIPAANGDEPQVVVGENVRVSEDGMEFTSAINGMVVLTGNRIEVTEVYEVDGHVDFSTGNVRMEKGSVSVKGNILQGFSVQSAGNLTVSGTIEGAQITAAGDIMVKEGITMSGSGMIRAEGSVYAKFISNARVEAGGDIVVANEVVNSTLKAGGKVMASKGRGKILAGKIVAQEGVEANEIGSHMGVVCRLEVGTPPVLDESLHVERKTLIATLQKIDGALGFEDDAVILGRVPKEKRQVVAKLLATRKRAKKKLDAVNQAIENERRKLSQSMNARIKVRGVIHADTSIMLYGKGLPLEDDLKHATIYWDAENARPATGNYS